jgi:cleavage stimulation factor subunit 3
LTTDQTGQNRQTITQAYEFVLGRVGIDVSAGRLWLDYIEMLKTGPGDASGSSWQDKQKMDTLRKVYQRAVSIPHNATLEIWRDYDKFEMSLNKQTVSSRMYYRLCKANSVTGTQEPPREISIVHDRTKCHQCSRQ